MRSAADRFFSLARLGALLTKQFIQMRRDRITFAMMLGVPLMQLVLFGFAIYNDPKSLPAALVATSNDQGIWTELLISAAITAGVWLVADTYRGAGWLARAHVFAAVPSGWHQRL